MISNISLAHTIYAPDDIPLLDNRFRIDPLTEQVTFILNHSKGPQTVVLVRPDGSKMYYKEHPASVAWVATSNVDIITIEKPMTGPWQAIASLDGDNRIKLISKVELKTNKLPLKLFHREYITTNASLYYDDKIMTEKNYLSGAKLSVQLIGEDNKSLAFYKDNGQHYDKLPFDGTLTARLYIDIEPGRYLLSVRTKNNVFTRNQNQDAVVFPFPITYEISSLGYGSDEAEFTFKIDSQELDPKSVMIDGTIKDDDGTVVEKLLANSADGISKDNSFTHTQKIDNGNFTLSGKIFATTKSGRNIELQLTEQNFTLSARLANPTIEISDEFLVKPEEEIAPTSIWENIWVIVAIALFCLILIVVIVFIILKRRKKKNELDIEGEFSMLELQTESIDPKSTKKDS